MRVPLVNSANGGWVGLVREQVRRACSGGWCLSDDAQRRVVADRPQATRGVEVDLEVVVRDPVPRDAHGAGDGAAGVAGVGFGEAVAALAAAASRPSIRLAATSECPVRASPADVMAVSSLQTVLPVPSREHLAPCHHVR
jgi:hypothetical protein